MRRTDAMRRHASWKKQARSLRPLMEAVEDRILLTTFIVKNTTDNVTTPAAGSLRAAILASNAAGGTNTIQFNIAASGIQTIALVGALPTITTPVTIDGTSENGYGGTPLIDLEGSGAGQGVDGLDISAGSTTVQGLAIGGFSGEGINLSAAGSNTITANYLGTTAAGTVDANGLDGILVQSGSNTNTISDNTISGNTQNGIYLNGQAGGSGTTATSGNIIIGNFIGTGTTGASVAGNKNNGIEVQNAPNTVIGGTTAAARNIISGNKVGLGLYNNSDTSVIEGNYIGTDVSGSNPLGNTGDGIELEGISNSTIGGTASGAGNVISGNDNGINCFVIGSTNITIQGNLIGTNAAGTARVANAGTGITISGPTNVTIGGTTTGARNVISGNTSDGISTGLGAVGLVVQGNYIGVGSDGVTAIGNGGDGVQLQFNSSVVVGGTATGAGNIIANNGFSAAFDHSGVVVGFNQIVGSPILGNSIYNNENLGIENANSGAQVAPTLNTAVSTGNTGTITGSLTSAAGTYRVELFSTPTVNVSGNAEGETFLGFATVTITAGPNGTTGTSGFTAATAGFNPLTLITATATPIVNAAYTGTSVFSAPITSTGSGPNNTPPVITVSGSPTTVAAGQNVTETFTISNNSSANDVGVGFNAAIPTGTTFFAGSSSTGVAVTATGGTIYATIGTLAADTSVTVTVVLTAGAGAVPSFTITGNVTATVPTIAEGADSVTSAATIVTSSDDLYATLIGPSGSVQTGQDITYTVTVGNNGPSTGTGVVLTDTLPAGTTFVSASSTTGETATVANGVLTDDIGNVAAGDLVVITITVATSGATAASVTNTATVSGDASVPDSDPTNNTATVTTTVIASADVAINSETVAPTSVVAGNTVTFTINVANNGPSVATGALVTDTLPAGLTFVSGTAAGGQVTAVNGVVTAPLGDLASGATGVVTIVALTGPAGSFADSAVITSTATDPDPANNTSSATVAVTPLVDLSVSLSGPTGSFNINNPITYTATIANAGPSPATDVVLTDPLFAGATFVSASVGGVAGGSVLGGIVSVPVGTIAAGSSVTVTIILLPTQAGTVTNTVTVGSTEGDSNPVNNSSSITTTLVVPQPIIEFSATTYTTNEDAGTAAITLTRVGDTSGTITVHFSTVAGGNATPGLDYTPVSTTVTFPAGVSEETVLVPVLPNPYDRTNEFVNLQLDTPTNAILPNGATSVSAVLESINLDPVLVGPTIGDVRLYGTINAITGIEIQTTGALDPTRAALASNYTLIAYGGNSTGDFAAGTIVPAAEAVYNPATGLVLVIPSVALPTNELFLLDINGTRANGITDLAGNPLNSVYGSVGASDYLLTFARGNNLTYTDENGALVNLKVTGPGTIDIDRTVGGQVGRLQVLGATKKTVLSGTVKNSATHRTTIGTVLGLGQFGSVVTKLYTPPFYVTNPVYPTTTDLNNTAAVDTLIGTNINTTTTTTTTKKKTTKVTKAVVASVVAKHPHAALAHATAHSRVR